MHGRRQTKTGHNCPQEKKYQEQLLETSQKQLDNVQQMVDSVEFAIMEKKVFEGLKEGNKVLQALHAEMSIDDVENLMAETEDAIAYQNEIESIIGGKLSQEDEDDITAQLEELEKEVLAEKLPKVPATPLPEPVPEPEEPEPEPVEKKSPVQTRKKEKVLVAE